MEAPRYSFPVSLIPGGCPQFLDFSFEAEAMERRDRRFACSFRVERQPGMVTADGQERLRLHCLEEDENGAWRDAVARRPSPPPDYTVDARKCLAAFAGRWLPLPVLRLRDAQGRAGEALFEAGPANWARCRLRPGDESDPQTRLVIAFDLGLEDKNPAAHNFAAQENAGHMGVGTGNAGPGSTGPGSTNTTNSPAQARADERYFALSPEDVAANAVFALARHPRDNTWFVNEPWVDRWLFNLHEQGPDKGRSEEQPLLYLANYLTFLELLHRLVPDFSVRIVSPDRDRPVDVDLILDIGNSRTTGILVETPPQRMTNLNNSYLLRIRDLSRPEKVYAEPFATMVEFAEASFGDEACSRLSGRRTPAFVWPSAVRMGPEAARLAASARRAEGDTGMSSPKRYLWDERLWRSTWRYNTEGGYEPMVTRGAFARLVNHMGTPLDCFDDPEIARNPLYRSQEREIAFESQFTRSSLMMFLMAEIILQALVTINSPAMRGRRELSDLPRRLRRIVLTVPPGMPVAEQRIYRRMVRFAVRTLWRALGWEQSTCFPSSATSGYQPAASGNPAWEQPAAPGNQPFSPDTARHPSSSPGAPYPTAPNHQPAAPGDYRQCPEIRFGWDEASCTQLVYLYNEIAQRFSGDAHQFFRLRGRTREGHGLSLRVAGIDIGGGTTDLSIATYTLENDEHAAPRLRPQLELRDGFSIAGDDILRQVIVDVLLAAIARELDEHGLADPRGLLAECFGRDVLDNSQEQRKLRARFARHLAAPVALALLAAYEADDPLRATPTSFLLREVFASPDQENIPPESIRKPYALNAPPPPQELVDYLENAVKRLVPDSGFSLMNLPLLMEPEAMDACVSSVIRRVLTDLCELVHRYDCDILLLTGRPSKFPAVINTVISLLPLPSDRIVPMAEYRVGRWYPFVNKNGMISDPKTTVSMGAILCALAEGHLEGFSFVTTRLAPSSTARHIGETDPNGQLTNAKVWFSPKPESSQEQELEHDISFTGPLFAGFRQFPIERWPATRFYLIDFIDEKSRRAAADKLPYQVTLRFRQQALDETGQDEGELTIAAILDKHGLTPPGGTKALAIRLQTLPLDEGYWLDTGVLMPG